jgi:uncharacterized protein (TIGR02266 family)
MTFAAVQKHPRYRVSVSVGVVMASGEVEEHRLEDISLGGAFVQTTSPAPPGSFIRLKLPMAGGEAPLTLMGSVVHVIDIAGAETRARAPGMGVQFDGMSPDAQLKLHRFVETVLEEERRARARRLAVRFVDATHVEVTSERAGLARLWLDGLESGELKVEGQARMGSRVAVRLGPLALSADVVGNIPANGIAPEMVVLQLVDLSGVKRAALERFIDGTASSIAVEDVRVIGPPLTRVLGEARRLFNGLKEDDLFGAIGLDSTATQEKVSDRIDELLRLFSDPHPDASPPQRARLQSAVQAVAELEPVLLGRLAALRAHAPALDLEARDQVSELVAEADFFEAADQKEEARRLLLEALEIAPEDTGVRLRLTGIQEALDVAKAMELLSSAEALARGIGTREDAIKLAREASRISWARDVRHRALRLFANFGAHGDAVVLGQLLLDENEDDELALLALLQVHEDAREWADAASIVEALLRLHPDDSALRERARKIVAALRS